MERTGCIYKITNTENGKIYIGQTAQSPPIKRWEDHYREAFQGHNNPNLMYNDMRTQGIADFSFQIIKENIPMRNLLEEEIYYINKYDSTNINKGYNISKGGYLSFSSKITKEKARMIAQELIDKPEYTMADIARLYDISDYMISDINMGDTWKFDDFSYPIRDNSKNKNLLNKEQVFQIYDLLKNGVSATDISKKFEVSIASIANINCGKVHKYLNDNEYPIVKFYNSVHNLSKKELAKIIYTLVNKKDVVYRVLAEEMGMTTRRKTFGAINRGKIYKDMIKDLGIVNFPIRENYSINDTIIQDLQKYFT